MAHRNDGRTAVESAKTSEDGDWLSAPEGAKVDSGCLSRISSDPTFSSDDLSIRAENVLKTLASELINEIPPQGRWIPPDTLLQLLTYKHLSRARNCGPQTTAEIIKWAQKRGKAIKPSFHAGKSLSEMWEYTIAKFSTGEISKQEVAEALEKSTRRRNTRIPVEVQKLLLQLVNSSPDE